MARDRTLSDGRAAVVSGLLAVVAGLLAVGLLVATPAVGSATATGVAVSEEAYQQPVPEPGDPYFEAAADDGSWISYINPRDEYRSPYLGDGSGKICVTLLNEAGEPIVGETVPNTTVTVPTGDEIGWHTRADPMVVEYPLTDNYERPLDADQFGTTSELPQGDGYLDAHCIETHGNPETATIEYGEVEIDGEHADRIEVVGYVQQQPGGDGWDTSVDPIEDAESYEDAGGSWTYRPDASHGQVVAVLQLTGGEHVDGDNETNADRDQNGNDDTSVENDATRDDTDDADGAAGDGTASGANAIPGFGAGAAVLALSIAAFAAHRRSSRE
ncbi:PGF-CTERM sorting domain-containing protein [Natronococcus wangiae]|uniref:PGF-CTERM sorting domain-containing protein n=1 Tax=Natronococcus wangiae TaxID=3068275 RepID=UPI00273E9C0E|nr:PGF-CTERM sorting domain-containing protein [Natronococcus sp. AD5]